MDGTYIGLDIGTSGCKSGIFDKTGKCYGFAKKSYMVECPMPGWMELNPAFVWENCMAVLAESLTTCDKKSIRAISVSSQGEAVFPVNAEGEPVCNSPLSFDLRSDKEAKDYAAALGTEEFRNRVLRPLTGMWTAPKIVWLQRHLPDKSGVWKYMLYLDYAIFKLSGETCLDYTMSCRTLLHDVRSHNWIEEALSFCGIDDSMLSTPVRSATKVGTLRKTLAEELGLSESVAVVIGAHDQASCAFGLGITTPSVVMDSMGTTETMLSISDRLNIRPDLSVSQDQYVVKNRYSKIAGSPTCGQAIDWFRQKVLKNRLTLSDLEPTSPEPSGLFVVPHFAGVVAPSSDVMPKAIMYGLTISHDEKDIYKAIIEGTCYEAVRDMEAVCDLQKPEIEIRACGGPTHSHIWMRLKASLYGHPLSVMKVKEAGALGAAMMAACGCGDIDPEEPTWAEVETVVEPEAEIREAHLPALQKYRILDKTVESIERELA